jgi:hypothetical protein
MISDNEARRIASEWYDGAGYRFVSTGTIDSDVIEEFTITLEWEKLYPPSHPKNKGQHSQDVQDLSDLLEYLRAKELRGPQEGWADVNF